MRLSGEIKRESILNANREGMRNMLKARACNAVGIVIHGRKHRVDNFLIKDPKVEHIFLMNGKNPADCIQKVVDAVLMEGNKRGKTDELVSVFFNKPEGQKGLPLFENGKEIADLINSFDNGHFKLRLITSIINVYTNTLDKKSINSILNAFNKLNNTYDEAGLLFLKHVNIMAEKYKDTKNVADFCDAVSSHSVLICLKQFSENEDKPALTPDFMRKMCELCTIMPEEKVARRVSLSMFEIYGSVIENGEMEIKTMDFILESLKKVAEESKDVEYLCSVGEGAKAIYVNGQKEELKAFFEIVRILPSHVDDMNEAAIGIGQVAKQIGGGMKAEELGQKYLTLKGGNIESRDNKEAIGGEFGEFEIFANEEEERESEYPEFEEEDEGDITVSTAEKLEMQFREFFGEGFGDAFEKKAMFVNKDEKDEFCNQYFKIFEILRAKSNKIDEKKMEKYLELAEKMFTNMNNDLKFAPVAYSVLGEVIDYPIEWVNNFVNNACKVNDDKLLMYLCNEVRNLR